MQTHRTTWAAPCRPLYVPLRQLTVGVEPGSIGSDVSTVVRCQINRDGVMVAGAAGCEAQAVREGNVEGGGTTAPVYHRRESPTQTPAVAREQTRLGEIWGYPSRWSHLPKVKAHAGPLPPGKRGIEFTTDLPPDDGGAPGRPEWSGVRPGIMIERDDAGRAVAKLKVVVTKNART